MQIISLWIAPPRRTVRESAPTTPPRVIQASLWVSHLYAHVSDMYKPALLFLCLVRGCPFVLAAARECVYASSLPTLGRERSPSLISHNREAVDRSVCMCACSRSKRSSPFLDKELYSATLNNFLGTEPVILRNLGQQHYSMKSEYLPAWLNGKSETNSTYISFSC